MKILKTIREEVVPLSSKQNIILLTIITCIFQFVLFYTPVLADTVMANGNIANSSLFNISKTAQSTTSDTISTTNNTYANNDDEIDLSNIKIQPSTSSLKTIRSSTHVITAYNSEVSQTDDDPCTTANGYNLCQNNQEDSVAANFLKFGTKIRIPELFGDRIFVVRDRMNKKHPNRLDVWMKERHDAINFGVKVAKIEIVE